MPITLVTLRQVVLTDGGTITTVVAVQTFTISEKPKYVSNYADGGTITTTDVYGVDEDEIA